MKEYKCQCAHCKTITFVSCAPREETCQLFYCPVCGQDGISTQESDAQISNKVGGMKHQDVNALQKLLDMAKTYKTANCLTLVDAERVILQIQNDQA